MTNDSIISIIIIIIIIIITTTTLKYDCLQFLVPMF